MDDLSDFFDFSKSFKRANISGGYVHGRSEFDPNKFQKRVKHTTIGTEYAEKYQQEQEQNLLNVSIIFFISCIYCLFSLK